MQEISNHLCLPLSLHLWGFFRFQILFELDIWMYSFWGEALFSCLGVRQRFYAAVPLSGSIHDSRISLVVWMETLWFVQKRTNPNLK